MKDILNHVIIHFEAGETVPEVHKVTKVMKSYLYKLYLNLDLWGALYPLPTVKLRCSKILLREHELILYIFTGTNRFWLTCLIS